jgi:hypothetical protein
MAGVRSYRRGQHRHGGQDECGKDPSHPFILSRLARRYNAAKSRNGLIEGPPLMQIAPGLYSLGDNTGGHVRAFLLDDGQSLTLIDTLRDKEGRLVLQALQQLGRQPTDVSRIILTHAHPSHLGGLAALKAATGARIATWSPRRSSVSDTAIRFPKAARTSCAISSSGV